MKTTVATIDDMFVNYTEETNIPLGSSGCTLWVRPIFYEPPRMSGAGFTSIISRHVTGFVVIVMIGDWNTPVNTALYVDSNDLLTTDLQWTNGIDVYTLKLNCKKVVKTERIDDNRVAYIDTTIVKMTGEVIKETK